jgi:hypothetical protein
VAVSAVEFNLVAQLSHFGWGALAVALPSAVWSPVAGTLCGAVFVAYAAVKEFWYDYEYEEPEVRGSSLQDFLFQLAGVLFAFLVIGAK